MACDGRRGLAMGAALLLLSAGVGVGCGGRTDARTVVARNLFDRHCAGCHGTTASGPAPVPGLGFQPADLRQLSGRYGTPLNREALATYIDGRHLVGAGEARLMPVWGEQLYAHLPDTAQVDEMRAGTIDLLIEYLESIQALEPSE